MKKITIAIDGYSSCGKSTMAKDLAKEIGYVYVDTDAMYRSVTLYALRHQLFEADGAVKTEELQKEMKNISISFKFNATTGRPDCYLNGELVEKEIRSLEVSNHVSPIAAVPFVREALVVAKDLAKEIGYVYVDTGAMYRSVTLYALRHQLFEADGAVKTEELQKEMKNISISFKFNATTGRPDCYLNGELVEKEIRSLEVSNHVSPIAAVPFVREALVEQQQKMGEDKGIVMDGRDIGTTVFPNAELKIFVTASSQVRAQRRFDELKEKGMPADFDAILKNVEERDYIDTHRETSPLRKADDAITLDNSNMTIPEQKAWLMEQYQKAIAE